MKAVALLPRSREVKVLELPEPALRSSTDVRVRTRAVGLCGTDTEVVQLRHGGPPPGEDFLIMGHEALGEVVEVGAEVRGLRPGDRVVPRVRRPCPVETCTPCRSGQPDFCITGQYTERGIQGRHGFCAEQFVEDVRYLHRVPAGLDDLDDVAVLTEPLTIAEKALRELERIQSRVPGWKGGGRAVVLGAGPVGLLGAMALQRAGFRTTMYSRSPRPNPKAEASERIGVPYLSSKEVSTEELARRAGPVDAVYEAAGVARAALDVLRILGPNGVFVLAGVPGPEEPLTLDGAGLMRHMVLHNQVVLGTVNAGARDFDAALEDLGRFSERWPGSLERLITARHPPEAYADVVLGRPGGIKHVIVFR